MKEKAAPLAGLAVTTSVGEGVFVLPAAPHESGQRWSCLYARSHHEKSIPRVCERGGVRYYLPAAESIKHYGRRTGGAFAPAFPGLPVLLCRPRPAALSRQENLLPATEVYGQQHLLGELREICRALAVSPGLETVPQLRKGKRVRITGGPFRGIVRTISEVRRHFRGLLNVSSTDRSVPLEVDQHHVELLE